MAIYNSDIWDLIDGTSWVNTSQNLGPDRPPVMCIVCNPKNSFYTQHSTRISWTNTPASKFIEIPTMLSDMTIGPVPICHLCFCMLILLESINPGQKFQLTSIEDGYPIWIVRQVMSG
jgi:hypothetical protein